jgi:hypothetical protein
MKKEVVIAILIGLILGLIVTYGIYRAKTSLNSGQDAASTTESASPEPSTGVHNSLILLSPQDESVQSTSDIKITGTTDPEALVIIFLNDKPQVIRADKSGNFSVQATLQQGSTVITVRTLDDDGNTAEQQRTVIFTTASLEESPTASGSGQATPSAKVASPTPTPKAR